MDHSGGLILVGYDPRARTRAPVEFAAELARLGGARIAVAAVDAGPPPPVMPAVGSLGWVAGSADDDVPPEAEQGLNELDRNLRARGIDVETCVLRGPSPAWALQTAAEDQAAALIVVASSRPRPSLLLGSTAQQLLNGSPCPVAAVPPDHERAELHTVGAAYAGSEPGREVLRAAVLLARRAGARLRAVTVVKAGGDAEGNYRARAEEQLRAALAAAGADGDVDPEVLVGKPAETLTTLSDDVDALVCGSRGYGPLRAVLLGSVSRRVVTAAHCPVIVLPRGVKASFDAVLAGTAERPAAPSL
jgi:nucleotide-binding universal stress UspA family protein